MKLTNKQKLSIWKSVKLNEDFFDDFDSNVLIDEPVDDFIDNFFDEHDYTYHIQFLIFMYPFVKLDFSDDCEYVEYVFDDPKYEHKLTIESGFFSMKKALEYILQATPIVTGYSEPKFCSSSEKIIKIFPFMNNKQSDEFSVNFNSIFITLKTSINLSRRKNMSNFIKLFYSFYRLRQIYHNLLSTNKFNKHIVTPPYIGIGVYKNNPYEKTKIYPLMQTMDFASEGLELIKFLNSKDETDK